MANLVIAIFILAIVLTYLLVRKQAVQYHINDRVNPISFGEVFITFVIVTIGLTAAVWLLDLLINSQVTL